MRFYGEEPSEEEKAQGFGNSGYQNPQQQRNFNNGAGRGFNNHQFPKLPTVWDTNTTTGRMKYLFFLTWFFFSIIIMIFLWNTAQKALGATVFGQLLAISGAIAFSKMKKNADNILFVLVPIVGIVTFVVSLIMYFGNLSLADSFRIIFPYIFMGGFLLVGLYFFIYFLLERKRKKARCTVPVKAVLIDLVVTDYRNSDAFTRHSHIPVYEYYHNGKSYIHKGRGITDKISLGDEVEAYLNPDSPTELYVVSEDNNLFVMAICGLIVVVSTLSIFFTTMAYII